MNANAVARNYGSLTPEERFRLILAAGGRGDEAEQARLANASGRITLSGPDYSPYAHAFNELSLLIFIELMAEALNYSDAFVWADDPRFNCGDDDDEQEEGDGAEEGPDAEPAEDDASERPAWQRTLDLALAAGFVLRTKADAWKLFCERMNVPPFLLWGGLPGFDRLQRALTRAEEAAFVPDDFLRWLNRIHLAGEPELTKVPLTVEGMASAAEDMFRQRVEWWGGS